MTVNVSNTATCRSHTVLYIHLLGNYHRDYQYQQYTHTDHIMKPKLILSIQHYGALEQVGKYSAIKHPWPMA